MICTHVREIILLRQLIHVAFFTQRTIDYEANRSRLLSLVNSSLRLAIGTRARVRSSLRRAWHAHASLCNANAIIHVRYRCTVRDINQRSRDAEINSFRARKRRARQWKGKGIERNLHFVCLQFAYVRAFNRLFLEKCRRAWKRHAWWNAASLNPSTGDTSVSVIGLIMRLSWTVVSEYRKKHSATF